MYMFRAIQEFVQSRDCTRHSQNLETACQSRDCTANLEIAKYIYNTNEMHWISLAVRYFTLLKLYQPMDVTERRPEEF